FTQIMADSGKLLSNILSNYLDQSFAIRPHITPKAYRKRDAGILADPFLCLEACNKYHNKEDS
ncbi:TPA: hypothetical protein ACQWFI_002016, partial [Neisseria subflava]